VQNRNTNTQNESLSSFGKKCPKKRKCKQDERESSKTISFCRQFAFAKRSGDEETNEDEEAGEADKRARFAFAKRYN